MMKIYGMSGSWDLKEDSKEVWLASRYGDDNVKINGEWKYSHLRVARRMIMPRWKAHTGILQRGGDIGNQTI